MNITKPDISTVPEYFQNYVQKAPGNDLLEELEKNKSDILKIINKVPKDQENFFYEEGKWTIKTVLRHIIDTERIFTYRALRFSRNDKTVLSSYDENFFADNSFTENLSLLDLKNEFLIVRDSTISLFKTMDSSVIDVTGKTNESIFTPRIIGWKTIGHALHHAEVINSRYLTKLDLL